MDKVKKEKADIIESKKQLVMENEDLKKKLDAANKDKANVIDSNKQLTKKLEETRRLLAGKTIELDSIKMKVDIPQQVRSAETLSLVGKTTEK